MGKEIDLMENYPKSKRDLTKRLEEKTPQDRQLARKFGKEFFDGDRSHGYGGFSYNSRFWEPVVPTFKEYYNLDENSKILDIGCAKGFMLYDFKRLIPGIEVQGIDISSYAIENAKEEVKEFLQVGDARKLPFPDNHFDLVISITTLHNLTKEDMKIALKEIMRVTKKDVFITLDAYRDDEEKKRMDAWNLTALTMMHTKEWEEFFKECGYKGDYYWFIP
ncbi:class I SAM-dependent methyltransferase [Arcobacter roscoffensis]|uniref:Class I SAM-dependent methyltransferase n=1 Tax=Arcobacter roscoffensis TaxID=2961520 RepID=A0ABY5E6N9_9BACT|nr:class I SAM-dependent methyltransferase [Arcobacter roscoffensis]UTJ06383.1 class I SAM-dependent methyltransferase [Arcobacter roscoffensis]